MRRALSGVIAAIVTALALVAAAPTAAFATSVIDEWHVDDEIGSIVASPDGARLYVATTDHLSTTTQIDVINAYTGAVITQYPSPAFSAVPYDLAISADGTRLFAASYDTNNVFVFETGAGSVSGVFETGAGPTGVIQAADGRIWVALHGADALQVFDPAFPDEPVTVPLGSGTAPTALALSPDGTMLYSANAGNGTVSKVVVSSLLAPTVTTVIGGAPSGLAVSPDGSRVVVTTDTGDDLVELDASTLAVTATVAVPSATALAMLPSSGRIVVARGDTGAVDLVDETTFTILESVAGVPATQTAVAVSPDHTRIFVGSSDGTITVLDGDTIPLMTTTTLPDGVTGIAYTATVAATGNPSPTFAVTSGALPAGLDLDADTGVISGSPTATGTSTFEITATNPVGASAPVALSITVRSIPAILTSDLPDGDVGQQYSATINATGVPEPTFAVTTGTLPPGLTLDTTTGVISGTPTALGDWTFRVTATNSAGTAAANLSITIHGVPLVPVNPLPAKLAATGIDLQAPLIAAGALFIGLGVLAVAVASIRRRRA